MRHALRRKYGRFLAGQTPAVGERRKYRGWRIQHLRGEYHLLDPKWRFRGIAMTWQDARDQVDDFEDGHAYGEREAGARDVDEMVRAASAPTAKPPPGTETMWGQIEYDRRLKALRGRKGR
jgi:hypothetical protein